MNEKLYPEFSPEEEEKKKKLYFQQKELLDTFLEHHTITREQYEKSLGDLTMKMGMEAYRNERK